jgi:hypothetical protein
MTEEGIEELQEFFLEEYDTDYWYYKLKINYSIYETPESATEIADLDHEGFDEISMYAGAEIIYTFYHITEALFGLMMAVGQDVPWLILKEYENYQIHSLVDVLKEGENEDIVSQTFYPSGIEDERVDESAVELSNYLKEVAALFDDKEVYNSYKHGLRLMTDHREYSFKDGETKEEFARMGGHSHIYLDEDELEADNGKSITYLKKVVKSFNVEYFYKLGRFNLQLIAQLLDMMEIQHSAEEIEEIEEVPVYSKELFRDVLSTGSEKYVVVEDPYEAGDFQVKTD